MGYKNCIKLLTEVREKEEIKDKILMEEIDKELSKFLAKNQR